MKFAQITKFIEKRNFLFMLSCQKYFSYFYEDCGHWSCNFLTRLFNQF